jgi:putative flippase GtrA
MTPATELAYRIGAAARRPASWLQLLKFGLVGCSGYVVNLGVFVVLVEILGAHHSLAAVGAFCVAVTNNFLWNRHWTFDAGEERAGFQAVRFLVISVAALVVNLAVLEALVAGAGVGSLVSQAIAVAVAMPFNFVGNKLWTFAS